MVLRAWRKGARLRVSVWDTGIGLRAHDVSADSGVGLDNVRQRLAALYGNNAHLSLRSNAAGGVIVELALPT